MKRGDVIKKLKKHAKAKGVSFDEYELTNHTGFKIGNTKSTLGRHSEIDDVTARKFWEQFSNEFGKGWWRK